MIKQKFEWYHAHIYFTAETQNIAAEVKENAKLHFRNRIRLSPLISRPIGPHPLPMFELDFYGDDHNEVTSWLEANRQGLDILIHPLSGDALADHTALAVFLGNKLALNLDAL